MICAPCRNQRHDECPAVVATVIPGTDVALPQVIQPSKTWCDCGHREPPKEKK